MSKNRAAGLDVRTLEDREVLFFFGDDPAIDRKTGVFGPGWHSGGLEPADGSHDMTRNVESNKTNLTGGQTATSYRAADVNRTVNLIQGSPVLDKIEWPDTVVQGGTLYRKHTSQVAKAFTATVHKYTSGITHIQVSREKAQLTAAERNRATDPAGRPVNIDYNNGSDEVMFEERYYKIGKDGSVTQVKEKIFKDIANLDKLVNDGKAFVPKASADGMKAFVPVEDTDTGDGVELIEFKDPDTGKTTTQDEDTTSVKPAGSTSTSGTTS